MCVCSVRNLTGLYKEGKPLSFSQLNRLRFFS